MFGYLRDTAYRFRREERGAVLLLFLIFFIPLMLVTAVVIDFGQFLTVKRQLSAAIDAAALSVAQSPSMNDTEIKAHALDFVNANYPESGIGDVLSVETTREESGIIRIRGSAEYNTSLLKFAGFPKFGASFEAQAFRKENRLEVVMVLDNTGSMYGAKMKGLKDSAKLLTEILLGATDADKYVKIGLVPFTTAVNIGARKDYKTVPWLDSDGRNPVSGDPNLHHENIDLPKNKTLFDLFKAHKIDWSGCVRARAGEYAHSDKPPNPDIPESLWVPLLAPDEPDTGYYANDYLVDAPEGKVEDVKRDDDVDDDDDDGSWLSTGDCETAADQKDRQKCVSKYKNKAKVAYRGPNNYCVAQPVLGLDNIKQNILDAIDGMQASGNTVIPAGLEWGWHLISSDAPFTEAAPYDDQDTIKVIILLTDGENAVGGGGNQHNKSLFTAYGYAAQGGHLGPADGSQAEETLDSYVSTLCSRIKEDKDGEPDDEDISLYTIAFGVREGSNVDTLLKQCASSEGKYFNSPTPDNLRQVFEKIAIGLSELRLAK